jgi:hypothetical protein
LTLRKLRMLFLFDGGSLRSDEPSDFFRLPGSDLRSSIPGILSVQAGTVRRLIVPTIGQFAEK